MLTTLSLPAGREGVTYGATLAATGGSPPYIFAVSAGKLPPGLMLESKTGAISGKPTIRGHFDFTITVTDARRQSSSRDFTIDIAAELQPAQTALRFLSQRGDLLLSSEPDSNRQMDRLRGGCSSNPGGGSSATVAEGEAGSQLAFATSLAQLKADAASAQDRMGLGAGQRPSPPPSRQSFDVWVEGQVATFDHGGKSGSDGHFGLVYLGADYVVTPSLLVGVLLQYDDAHQRVHGLDSTVTGSGWMAGPYAMLQMTDHLYWQMRVMWGQSSNAINTSGAAADHFDGDRWLARTALVGRWRFGDFEFRPSASIAYVEERVDGLDDPQTRALRVSYGQAKLGPEVAYRYLMSNGALVEPRLGVQGIWTFAEDASVATAGNLGGPDDVRARLDAGLRILSPSGLSLDMSGGYDGLGAQGYHAVSGRVQLRMTLD